MSTDLTDNELPENPKGVNIAKIKAEAKASQRSRISKSRDNTKKKEQELNALMDEARENHKRTRKEQDKKFDKSKGDINALITSVKKEQQHANKQREQELAAQQEELEALLKEAKEKFEDDPSEETRAKKQKLEELEQKAREAQARFERELRQKAENEVKELANLSVDLEEKRRKMQAEQEAQLKKELNNTLSSISAQKDLLKHEFDTLVKKEKRNLDNLIHKVVDADGKQRKKHKQEIKKNADFINEQKKICIELIKQGKVEEAYKKQRDIRNKVKACKHAMQEDLKKLGDTIHKDLSGLEESTIEEQKRIEKESDVFMDTARTSLMNIAKRDMKFFQDKLVKKAKDDLKTFEVNMSARHKVMKDDQIKATKKIKYHMQEQIKDSMRRRAEKHKNMIRKAKGSIIDFEKDVNQNKKHVKKMHKDMVNSAQKEIKNIISDSAYNKSDDLAEITKEADESYDKTVELITKLHGKKLQEERIKIASNITKQQHESEDALKKLSEYAKKQMVLAGKESVSRNKKLQEEHEKQIKQDLEERADLQTLQKEKEKEIEEYYKAELEAEKLRSNLIIKESKERQHTLLEKQKELEKLIDTVKENKISLDENTINDILGETGDEDLLELINIAKQKQRDAMLEEKNIIAQAELTLAKTEQEVRERLLKEKADLHKEFSKKLKDFEIKNKERKDELKKVQGELSAKLNDYLNSMMDDAEKRQKIIKEQREAMEKESQKKLSDLHNEDYEDE